MFKNNSIVVNVFLCFFCISTLKCVYLLHLSTKTTTTTGKSELIDSTTFLNNSSENVQIISDDLIFLETKSNEKNETYLKIDLNEDNEENFDNLSEDDLYDPETELDLNNNNNNNYQMTSIDMSDFVALVPVNEIKSIIKRYYNNDPETQRAFKYLRSNEFFYLKEKIIDLPEINSFIKFFNSSGLDVISFMCNLTNLTSKTEDFIQINQNIVKLVENNIKQESVSIISETITTIHPITENLNGLHGLVDSILDLLPQDQILSLFFDKMESSEKFSKLIENIGSPEFSQVLQNIKNSNVLRNLILTLHNNGIYLTRIAESLKAYFFLGSF